MGIEKNDWVTANNPINWRGIHNRMIFTSQRIDEKQLVYLKTILGRPEYDWSRKSLYLQRDENIWWAKQVNELLDNYDLDYTWDEIIKMPFAEWKRRVKQRIEAKHLECIKEGYHGPNGEKTKTAFIRYFLEKESYSWQPIKNVVNRSKLGARAVIMGMSGMLDCAKNFHLKYKRKICEICKVIDDASHRINHCGKFNDVNPFNSKHKFDFQSIYPDNKCDVVKAEYIIRQLWDLSNGKNQMK